MKLRRWTRRVVATATVVGALGAGVATAVPAGAAGYSGASLCSGNGQNTHPQGPYYGPFVPYFCDPVGFPPND